METGPNLETALEHLDDPVARHDLIEAFYARLLPELSLPEVPDAQTV